MFFWFLQSHTCFRIQNFNIINIITYKAKGLNRRTPNCLGLFQGVRNRREI